jgi:hypothetical protein
MRLITINRETAFNPVELLGPGWKIDEQDERSLVIAQVDLSKIHLIGTVEGNETGEERLTRLKKAGCVRLDAKVFQAFWANQELIPWADKELIPWKQTTHGNRTSIVFDGTILLGPTGDRWALYMCWYADRWNWNYWWLGRGWDASRLSAVLTSI